MLTTVYKEEPQSDLKHVLDLSLQISLHAPPMKPFIRFSNQADKLYGRQSRGLHPSLFWDFDDTLQKILLKIARTIATPEELWQGGAEGSRSRSSSAFVHRKKWELDELALRKAKPWFETTPRDEFVFARIPYNGRLLYVGFDSGMECFSLAQRGYHVTAIHTDPEVVDVANDWARHFRFPFKAICADLTESTFGRDSFDSFIIDFYGSHPSMELNMIVQENLANAISDQGLGFVVASRKKYASYWFLMNTPYPSQMTRWLMKQAPLDFYYSKFDSSEERLLYGAYNKSYTPEALSSELGHAFDISHCSIDQHDPRYVLAVVRRNGQPDITVYRRSTGSVVENSEYSKLCIWLLSKIRAICDILRIHEQHVCHHFKNGRCYAGKNPLQTVDTEMSGFIDLLTEVFETIPEPPR